MKLAALLVAALAAPAAFAQFSTNAPARRPAAAPRLEYDVLNRAAHADYVVRGQVIEVNGAQRRDRGAAIIGGRQGLRNGALEGATYYIFHIEETLCGQRGPALPAVVYILTPRSESYVPGAFNPNQRFPQERLFRSRQYVLMLRRDPLQSSLVSEYELEEGNVYYRALEGERGVIELTDSALNPIPVGVQALQSLRAECAGGAQIALPQAPPQPAQPPQPPAPSVEVPPLYPPEPPRQ